MFRSIVALEVTDTLLIRDDKLLLGGEFVIWFSKFPDVSSNA